ncbi:MAG: NUDIX domain-containing protein [Bacteroidota bacterium]|nr:NUDIX domain-containing protein [Bacteroidota bacterium]
MVSAGLLMYNIISEPKIFLVHPGGPFFKNKDEGWWTIPKGLPLAGEELLDSAIREFEEETSIKPTGPYYELGAIKQKGGKTVHCWAFEGEWYPDKGIVCNDFEMEWPPNSGKLQHFPEVDKAEWMSFESAHQKINSKQSVFLQRLKEYFSTL